MKRKTIAILLALMMALTLLAACSDTETPPAPVEMVDREGNPITVPGVINTVISLGPANSEILAALGQSGKIIATDAFSAGIEGIDDDMAIFDMMALDGERILQLEPDVIFITGMTRVGGDHPLQIVEEAGICLVFIPSSTSIEGIIEDIRFIAAVMGAAAEGNAIITEMEREIEAVRAIGRTITEKKTVYFEISPAPWMFSFGNTTFLHEMIELIGAINIFAGQTSWMSVSDEAVLDANPDVILTSTNFLPDAIGEIMDRPGWDEITAIQNKAVFYIDTDSSNRPSHNITIALRQMAQAIYPELFR
jgi:iron complex transport system substrate-binding protein